jgi:hypothetical protein
MAATLQNVYLNIPSSEMSFLSTLAQKMGWTMETKAKPAAVHPKLSAREKHIAQFKEAIRETEAMVRDIRKNGTKGYQTMEEFLKTV